MPDDLSLLRRIGQSLTPTNLATAAALYLGFIVVLFFLSMVVPGRMYPGAVLPDGTRRTYKLNGLDISANVYTPANYDPKKSYPAVVVAHPNGGVKEQTAGLYA